LEERESLKTQLGEMLEERESLMDKIRQMQHQLDQALSKLQFSNDTKDDLTSLLCESEQNVQALQVALGNKEQEVRNLENNINFTTREVGVLRISRRKSHSVINEKQEELNNLKLKLTNSREYSSCYRENVEFLMRNLEKAKHKINELTDSLGKKEISECCLKTENLKQTEEICKLKDMLQTKLQELNECREELQLLRSKDHKHHRQTQIMINTVNKSDPFSSPQLTNTRRSTTIPNFFFLKSPSECTSPETTKRFENMQSTTFHSRLFLSNSSSENIMPIGYYTSTESDTSMSNDVGSMKFASSNNLADYIYLTATAVKYYNPDVDIKISEQIRLGEDQPFWKLFPFFTRILRLRSKRKSSFKCGICGKNGKKCSNGWKYFF